LDSLLFDRAFPVILTKLARLEVLPMDFSRNRIDAHPARRSQPTVPRELSGKWVAWDRDQTRIIGSGDTFEEAKEAAVAAGESAIFMARVPARHRLRFGRPMLYMVAVFIAHMA
jgi:hypothetical protein